MPSKPPLICTNCGKPWSICKGRCQASNNYRALVRAAYVLLWFFTMLDVRLVSYAISRA